MSTFLEHANFSHDVAHKTMTSTSPLYWFFLPLKVVMKIVRLKLAWPQI